MVSLGIYFMESLTHLDRHTSDMEPVREKHPLTQHPLESGSVFDLRNRESMSKVERAVHVGEGEVSEPFWILFLDLSRCEAFALLDGRCLDLEDTFSLPSSLILPL